MDKFAQLNKRELGTSDGMRLFVFHFTLGGESLPKSIL